MFTLDQIETGLLKGAMHIVIELRRAGYQALFAGGAVRDVLLGRPPSDLDVATSAPPEEVERLFSHTVPVGRQFGVVVVVIDNNSYEVATFRKESDYRNGRHPGRVAFADAKQDAERRDFTVNAIFFDPVDTQIIDYVGGQADLESRLVRTVGIPSERFEEDKLRLLRAVRFACQLGFEIEEETWKEIGRRANSITMVSRERILDELLKLLTGEAPARGLDLLRDSGLLPEILPEVDAMRGVEQPPEFHPEGDVYTHTRLMLEKAGRLTPTLALGILLHDVGKPPTFRRADRIRFDGHAEVGAEMALRICKRLRLPNEAVKRVVSLVQNHLRFIHVQEMRESTLKRFLRLEHFDEHLELHKLDCLASHRDLTNYEFCIEKLHEFSQEAIRPKPLVGGEDLIDMGFKPGPIFKEILTALEDRQLEGRISNREEALDWIRIRWNPEGDPP